jgi:hypothetical protein
MNLLKIIKFDGSEKLLNAAEKFITLKRVFFYRRKGKRKLRKPSQNSQV